MRLHLKLPQREVRSDHVSNLHILFVKNLVMLQIIANVGLQFLFQQTTLQLIDQQALAQTQASQVQTFLQLVDHTQIEHYDRKPIVESRNATLRLSLGHHLTSIHQNQQYVYLVLEPQEQHLLGLVDLLAVNQKRRIHQQSLPSLFQKLVILSRANCT